MRNSKHGRGFTEESAGAEPGRWEVYGRQSAITGLREWRRRVGNINGPWLVFPNGAPFTVDGKVLGKPYCGRLKMIPSCISLLLLAFLNCSCISFHVGAVARW